MVATSITINVVTSTINVATTVATSINIRLCQHADDKSLIESTMVWHERCHLAFAVANCVFNLRFAAHCWTLRRIAGEARNMTENAISILSVIFSVQLQQTEISERKLFIFRLGRCCRWKCHRKVAVEEHYKEVIGCYCIDYIAVVHMRDPVWKKYPYLHD